MKTEHEVTGGLLLQTPFDHPDPLGPDPPALALAIQGVPVSLCLVSDGMLLAGGAAPHPCHQSHPCGALSAPWYHDNCSGWLVLKALVALSLGALVS